MIAPLQVVLCDHCGKQVERREIVDTVFWELCADCADANKERQASDPAPEGDAK